MICVPIDRVDSVVTASTNGHFKYGRVVRIARIDGVVSAPPAVIVGAECALQRVCTTISKEGVANVIAVQSIVTGAAMDFVVSIIAVHSVVSMPSEDGVVLLA